MTGDPAPSGGVMTAIDESVYEQMREKSFATLRKIEERHQLLEALAEGVGDLVNDPGFPPVLRQMWVELKEAGR